MPETWTDAYLTRIGYDGSREPSLATLRALHERHMFSVPFENLDIHWKRPIVVDAERFLTKVVRDRRGGFCYELNGAFTTLLRDLGFDVTMLSARVVGADGTEGPPFDHMTLLVRFDDGSRWLADVGFGDSFVRPLNFDDRGIQEGEYRLIESHEWEMEMDGKPQFRFTLEPHELPDFAPMCDHQQYSPDSPFTKKRVCTLATPTGRVTLTDAKLIITRDGERTEVPVAEDEWDEVLWETFGIRNLRG
jgi:N-hydroxyarylamine O-acetyltransferase